MNKSTRVATAAAAAVAVSLLLVGRPAGACTCVDRELAEQVQTATTVFLGTVVTAAPSGATFDVSRVYKGEGPGDAPVSSGGPSCAVRFAEGRRYVVFASLQNATLSTDLCTGTTDDLAVAGRLSVAAGSPSAAPPKVVTVVTSRAIPIAAAAAMAGLVAVAALLAIRSSRRPRPIA